MAKIKIQGNAGGSGVFTVTSPVSNTNRTITLPDSAGTLLDENSSLPAANLTGTVADARISTLTASKLSGALPAISAASLTAIPAANITGTLPAINGANLTGLSDSSDYRPSGKSIIINGDMAIAQRSTSVASLGNGDSGYHTVDRWNWIETTPGHITAVGVWTQTQETLTSGAAWEDGFTKALKMDCTTAVASPAVNESHFLEYIMEGADVKAFKKGTPNAQTYTVAFWVKATKTGTHCINLGDRTNDRYIAATYTINTTNTWEKKVINLAADTTGSIAAGSYYQGENGQGMRLMFGLVPGGNYTSGGSLQTSWASWVTNKRLVGQVNNADSTSNNWHITGVQLEVGTYTAATLPPFQHESYADNLLRCQRYYQRGTSSATYAGFFSGSATLHFSAPLTCPLRASPTISYITVSGGANFTAVMHDGNDSSTSTPGVSTYSAGANSIALTCAGFDDGTDMYGANMYTGNNYLILSSEL